VAQTTISIKDLTDIFRINFLFHNLESSALAFFGLFSCESV